MTIVSNDPIYWPIISYFREASYFEVASLIVVLYDWALTFGQEFELIWRQRWSLMTVLYLTVRYLGIPLSFLIVIITLPSVPVTDAGCIIIYYVANWMITLVNIMLGVIMIRRLQAMYQGFRRVLTFIAVFFLAVQIASVVLEVLIQITGHFSGYELVLSGTHACNYNMDGDAYFLISMTWILGAVWEALALFLAVWIAVKHFRELGRQTTWSIGDCFKILVKTHVFYFASYAFVTSLQVIDYYTTQDSSVIYGGFLAIIQAVQMFVLGPRLILGVREYHARLVARSDGGTGMASIVFQERTEITTGGGV